MDLWWVCYFKVDSIKKEWYIVFLHLFIIIEGYYCDDKAFIFTLKNPHNVPPTRFLKRKESSVTTYNNSEGPIFGNTDDDDIHISDYHHNMNSYINNNGKLAFECHPTYKCSLYVNTNDPDSSNYFSVLDYEVYTY